MSDSPELPPDSPFAEFAEPRTGNKIEAYKARLQQDRKQTWARLVLFGCSSAGSALGAGVGMGIGFGPVVIPAALALGLVGALIGVGIGALLGVAALAAFTGRRAPYAPLDPGPNSLGGNQGWSFVAALMTIGAEIGALCGASLGAMKGASLVSKTPLTRETAIPWAMVGAALGLGLAVAGWWLSRRRGGRR